jgi:hypothetical protein
LINLDINVKYITYRHAKLVKVEVDDVNNYIDDAYKNPSLEVDVLFEERAIIAQIGKTFYRLLLIIFFP